MVRQVRLAEELNPAEAMVEGCALAQLPVRDHQSCVVGNKTSLPRLPARDRQSCVERHVLPGRCTLPA